MCFSKNDLLIFHKIIFRKITQRNYFSKKFLRAGWGGTIRLCMLSKIHPTGVCHHHIFSFPFVLFEKYPVPLKITQILLVFQQRTCIVEKKIRRLRRRILIDVVDKIKRLSRAFCNTYSPTINSVRFHQKIIDQCGLKKVFTHRLLRGGVH